MKNIHIQPSFSSFSSDRCLVKDPHLLPTELCFNILQGKIQHKCRRSFNLVRFNAINLEFYHIVKLNDPCGFSFLDFGTLGGKMTHKVSAKSFFFFCHMGYLVTVSESPCHKDLKTEKHF